MKPITTLHAPAGDPASGAGSGATGGAGSMSSALRETKQAVGRDVRQAASEIKASTRESVSHIKASAREAFTNVKDRAARLADEEKGQGAAVVDRYGSALHDSAKSFEQHDPNIAHFTHQAADRLQGAAEYLRQRDWHGLKTDAEDFGRRHPAIFFGGMFVAGMILGNVLKATSRPRVSGGQSEAPGSEADGEHGGEFAGVPREQPNLNNPMSGGQTFSGAAG